MSGTTSTSLTPQQSRAVSCREVSVVLSSGAGCGKTHVLTQRYLSHLEEDGASVGQVVAITFTERAARQMRERIRGAILAHLRAASDANAGRWAEHLRGLEMAQISTIHAFCGILLRQHAIEVGLDPHFDILEDVLSVNLEAEALTTCLQKLLTAQDQAGTDLRDLVLLYGWQPVVEAVQHLLRAWDERPWREWLSRPAEQVAREWQEQAGTLLPRYVEYLTAGCPKIATCVDLLRRNPPRSGTRMADNAHLLQEKLPRLAEAAELAAAVEELTEAAKVGRQGAKAWPDGDDYLQVKKALEEFREELRSRKLAEFIPIPEESVGAIQVGQRFLRVAQEAIQAYRDLKRLHGVVDFQDLLVMARDLLRDHEEVRVRLQERYRFLLIDELQDTDPVQMELVDSLCGAGLTQGKLFAVGDHAQSIYRFRGADVHLFRELRSRVPHAGRLNLGVNFRSQPAILQFTNALLGHRLQDYEELKAHHGQVNPGPCVEFLWSPRVRPESVNESRAREADWIARRIVAMLDREALVVEREGNVERLRPVRRGDVVLLFRAMTNVHLYEAALRQHGLDYYLVGGRAFFAQQEIYDLLNLLRALENPQDAVSLAGTLRSPFCCLSDEALFVLSRTRDGLWAGLHNVELCARLPEDQRARADRARRHLDQWRDLKDRLPIAALLGRIFADAGYDASTQFEFLGDRKLANLWKLVDLARTFDRSGLFGLAEFIQRLGDLVKAQPREEQAATQPENADVVRLMTIHQAKGLEFPVVIVPDVAAQGHDSHLPVAHWAGRLGCVVRQPSDLEDPETFTDFGWRLWQVAEEIEDWHEDLRTLYVACTRAQDYLILSAALEEPARPANSWMLTLAQRFDLQSGACLAADVQEESLQVRVIASEEALGMGAIQPSMPRDREKEAAETGCEVRSARGRLPVGVIPIPVSLRGKRIIRLVELETYLRRGQEHAPGDAGLRAAERAYQFDAEDGSDRRQWFRRRDVLAAAPETAAEPRDRILRSVLQSWDFREAHGWRPLLEQELLAHSGPEGRAELRRVLQADLGRFADSATVQRLAMAEACHREVEFLVDWPAETGGPRVALHGLIDCLWQDDRGDWHLLAFVTERNCTDGDDTSWGGRKPGLLLSAWALHRHLGTWPRSATLFCLATGAALTVNAQRLRQRQARVAAGAAIRELLSGNLSEPEASAIGS